MLTHQPSTMFWKLTSSDEILEMFSSYCGGQNKNTTLMSMLASSLLREAASHIEKLEIVFPIIGHSFLPRPCFWFGRKTKKKLNVIIDRKEYEAILEKSSTVLRIITCNQQKIFNRKTEANNVLKKKNRGSGISSSINPRASFLPNLRAISNFLKGDKTSIDILLKKALWK